MIYTMVIKLKYIPQDIGRAMTILLAKKQGYETTFKQLKKWGLNFHELKMGKTSYDLIIDDKSLGFKKLA